MMKEDFVRHIGKYQALLDELCLFRQELITDEINEKRSGFYANYGYKISVLREGTDEAIEKMLLHFTGVV